MARWDPDASGRLQRAAIELFAQHGYADTTVPQIAAHAGLTTRTFFRHFVDKREVLFAGEDDLVTLLSEVVGSAPPELSAMATLEHALKAAAQAAFEPRREWMRQWRDIVNGEHALRERGLSKQQMLVAAAVKALGDRGVDAPTAELAAGAAFVAFQAAAAEWATEETSVRPLAGCLEVWFSRMHHVVAGDQERG